MTDPISSGMLPDYHLITVFEAANDTLKEVYVGTTSLLIDQVIRGFQVNPPRAAKHWKKDQRILFRCVEYSIAIKDAAAFIEAYIRSDALKGWKVLREIPANNPG